MSKDAEKYPIVATALSRYGHQYGESEKFKQFIKSTIEPIVDQQALFFNLLNINLDNAKGIKLDLIGRLIGAPAVVPNALPQPYFGFEGQPLAQEFGELDDEAAGGFWRDIGQQSNTDLILSADMYRVVVNAQIIKNASRCTPDDIITIARMIIRSDIDFKYIDYKMAIIIAPSEPLSAAELQLLKMMVPRPSGVRFLVVDGQYDAFTMTDEEIIAQYADDNYQLIN